MDSGAIGDAHGVDLNTASEEELDRVGGLGRERVRRLLEHRPFHRWEDLTRVEGVGETLVDDLRKAGATLGGQGR